MNEYTEKERHIINELYARKEKENASFTVEELELLTKYENDIAIRDYQLSEDNKKRAENEKAIINAQLETERIAQNNLEKLHAYALTRLERLEKREHPTIEQAQKTDMKAAYYEQ